MTEHETKVKVTLNVYVELDTDSHPEDIDENTMQDLLTPLVTEELKSLDSEKVDAAIVDWDYEEVIMFVDGVRHD
jgi:hypothetical protein